MGFATPCNMQYVCENGCFYDWDTGTCEGSPDACSVQTNETDCYNAGCSWE